MLEYLQEKFESVLIKVIKFGVFFTILTPMIMNSHFFFPFIVPKNVLFRITVEVLFALYLILAINNKKYRPSLNAITISVLVFLFLMVLTTFTGIGIYSSIWGNYERMDGLFAQIHYLLYFIVLLGVFKSKKDWHDFLAFSIFISFIACFIAFGQLLKAPFLLRSSGGERLTGSIGNATFFAAYLIFNLFFILYFIFSDKKIFPAKSFFYSLIGLDIFVIAFDIYMKVEYNAAGFIPQALEFSKFLIPLILAQLFVAAAYFFRDKKYVVKALLVCLFIFEFFIFFSTQTRGAIVGFIISIFSLFILIIIFGNRRQKIISVILLGVFLVVVFIPFSININFLGVNFSIFSDNPTIKRLASISFSDITTQSRILTWQASWRGWTDSSKSFLLGYGPENYYYAFNKYFPVEIYRDAGSQIWFDRAHNIIFDIGVTTGVIGLISYLAILFLVFAKTIVAAKKKYNQPIPMIVLAVLVIAYLVQNFFVFDTINTLILFYLYLAFVAVIISVNDESNNPDRQKGAIEIVESSRVPLFSYVNLIVVLLLVFFIYVFNVKLLLANNYIYKAIQEENKAGGGYNDKSVEYLDLAISRAVTGKFEARQQFAEYVRDAIKSPNITQDKATQLVNKAGGYLEQSIDEEPQNVRHYIYLGAFYNSVMPYSYGKLDYLINLLSNKAVSLSPTRPHIYFEIGQAKLYQGKIDEAISFFEKGVALNPAVVDSNIDLIKVYIVAGKQDKVDEQLSYLKNKLNYNLTTADYKIFIDLYQRVKNYKPAIDLQQKLIKLESTAENYATLAVLYARIGDNKSAQAAATQAASLDPSFASELKLFLDKLNKGDFLDKK